MRADMVAQSYCGALLTNGGRSEKRQQGRMADGDPKYHRGGAGGHLSRRSLGGGGGCGPVSVRGDRLLTC